MVTLEVEGISAIELDTVAAYFVFSEQMCHSEFSGMNFILQTFC